MLLGERLPDLRPPRGSGICLLSLITSQERTSLVFTSTKRKEQSVCELPSP